MSNEARRADGATPIPGVFYSEDSRQFAWVPDTVWRLSDARQSADSMTVTTNAATVPFVETPKTSARAGLTSLARRARVRAEAFAGDLADPEEDARRSQEATPLFLLQGKTAAWSD